MTGGRERAGPWVRRVALGVGLWLVYVANGREIGAGDTVPAILQPVAIARGDGLVLDRFEPVLRSLDPAHAEPGRFPPYYAGVHAGHLVSRFPVAPALVVLPLVWPQIALLDARHPGWDATPAGVLFHARRMAKNASAAVAAATAVVLHEALVVLGLGPVALAATLVAALGSPLFVVAAQSPWHHGPAALMLVVAIALLARDPRPAALAVAGAALAVMVANRLPTLVFAVPLVLWRLRRDPAGAPWLLAPLAAGGACLLAYNLAVFGSPLGGQGALETARIPMHAVDASWANPLAGAAGTLASPSRGLLLYCPWVAATLLVLPAVRARLAAVPLVVPLVIGLAGHLAVFASYSAWWAGWCFGPRYWTEAIPVLAVLYAVALDGAVARVPWARVPLLAAGVAAVAIHAAGAVYYPSSWNAKPVNVDHHHARLWDWRDTELARGLREGPRAREFTRGAW